METRSLETCKGSSHRPGGNRGPRSWLPGIQERSSSVFGPTKLPGAPWHPKRNDLQHDPRARQMEPRSVLGCEMPTGTESLPTLAIGPSTIVITGIKCGIRGWHLARRNLSRSVGPGRLRAVHPQALFSAKSTLAEFVLSLLEAPILYRPAP
jgi:hypothetical protein